MKYNILINQKAITELNAELPTELQLDLKDATILAWMMDFHAEPKTMKIIRDNVVFFWVAYSYLIAENPLLGINNKVVVRRHLDKLITIGLLEKHIEKEENSKTFFSINQKAFDLLKGSSYEDEKGVLKSTDTLYSKVQTPCTQKSTNNTIKDSSIVESNALAWEYLKKNNPVLHENLLMKYANLPYFENIVNRFNYKYEVEGLVYDIKKIYYRFLSYADSYVANEQKNQPEEEKPYVYLRKIS